MLKDVMNQILEAEKSADEIVFKANADAKEIHLSSLTEIDKTVKEFEAETKRQTSELLKRAYDEGEAKAAETIKSVRLNAEDSAQRASKNVQGAVEYVTDGIIKKYGK